MILFTVVIVNGKIGEIAIVEPEYGVPQFPFSPSLHLTEQPAFPFKSTIISLLNPDLFDKS